MAINPTKLTPPLGIERDYQKELRSIVTRVKDIIDFNIVQNLPTIMAAVELFRPKDQKLDADDIGRKVEQLFIAVRAQVGTQIPQFEIDNLTQFTAEEINTWNKEKVTRAIKNVLGVDIFISEPWLKEELRNFASRNAALIKSVNKQFIDQVETTVFEGMRRGTRHEEISKQILGFGKDELGKVSKFRLAKTRANLIGRDQINKMNGNLTRLRQTEIGVKKYVWRTVNDNRVRHSHDLRNGQTYTWKKGSELNTHPGDEINCRCYGEPDLTPLLN